jgi:hypothetical protein
MTEHPGTITFIEAGVAGERVFAVDAVPESVAFAQEGQVRVPVVRVVAEVVGDQRVIKSYGVDGRLLATTYQRRS